MKKTKFKNLMNLSWFILLALIITSTACKKKNDDPIIPPTPPVEDGTYVLGNSTSYTALVAKGKMEDGIDDVTEELRDGMYVKYISVSAAGDGFNVVIKAGATETTYGPATNEVDADLIQRGTLGASNVFSVPTDGLYYFVVDVSSNTYFIAPAAKWGIIGQSVGDWGTDIEIATGAWSKEAVSWETTDIEMREGPFKFRQVGFWKVVMDDYAANTNFGGVVSGTLPDLTTTFVNGGNNYEFALAQEGMYTVALSWTDEAGFTSALTKTGDVEPPPEYFEQLYMIGPGVSDWETDLPTVAVYGHKNLFWKIVWITENEEFKFRPEHSWNGDEFGFDADLGGGEYSIGTASNLTVAATGYYMVVVDLETLKISVGDPAVYLIGDCVGGWDQAVPENLFTVDNENEVVTITKDLFEGDLRMYSAHPYFADWWHVEFMIFDNVIEFRADGNDQERIHLTAGTYTIDLNFKTGAGSIQ
jgi:hypothetical protein